MLTRVQRSALGPTTIELHQESRVLEIVFADGKHFKLPCELLRVYSPSAEVRGHGPGREVLQIGKKDVEITHIEPVGSYAVHETKVAAGGWSGDGRDFTLRVEMPWLPT